MSDAHTRPAGVSDATVAAAGRTSEALEWVERARGRLYDFHQMIGRADLLFEEAAELLREAGHEELAQHLEQEVVGRNVLDGRWTFQIVEEYEELYNIPVHESEARVRGELLQGRRHVYESEMKEARRTRGSSGHERRPPAAHGDHVVTD
jgi:hypothetical protein